MRGHRRMVSGLYPVIAAVVRHKAGPGRDLTDAVAGRLFQDMIVDTTEVFVTKLPLLEHAEALHHAARSMDLQTENHAGMLHQMGYLNNQQGKYAGALEWYQKALQIDERVLGKDHPSTATTYNNIALVYDNMGEYAGALEWYQKALQIDERVLGKDHPSTATTYNNIALVYDRKGEYASALEWYQKALPIFERVLGKDHPDTATTYHNIGTVYFEQGDYREALKWLEKALRIRLRVLGAEHPSTKNTQGWIDDAQRQLSSRK